MVEFEFTTDTTMLLYTENGSRWMEGLLPILIPIVL